MPTPESGSTDAIIGPILVATYGDNGMTRALIVHLADLIDRGGRPYGATREREYTVMRTCWDWFPGGGTAEGVARRIEGVLPPEASDAS